MTESVTETVREPVPLLPAGSALLERVQKMLPEGGNLSLCLTCGLCASGCPAAGLHDMDPRKFLRLCAWGQDEEVASSPWVWMCTMCQRCVYACPMHIDIPRLIYEVRSLWPRDARPKGILGSCEQALNTDGNSAMGARSEDFQFVVEDILEEVREEQPDWKDLGVTFNRKGAKYFLNQNSREPVTEPDEMVPLWKILHTVGADWTYSTRGWAAENYCMFLADDASWETVVRNKVAAVEDLGCRYWLNTE
jgi:heterodisulfide reductase subunit C